MADRIVQVRHPALVLRCDDCIGRDMSWLACSIPVRLRERDPASFRLVQRRAKSDWDMPYEMYACEGGLDSRSPSFPDEQAV